MAQKKSNGIWNLFERIQGDKVIWMVVIFLTVLSTVALFSATSLDSSILSGKKTRVHIFITQVVMVGIGFSWMTIIYKFMSVRFIRWFSQLGWGISMALLIPLLMHVGASTDGVLPGLSRIIQAQRINEAWRTLLIGGKIQLHVFEVVKVNMVLYLAWAVDAWKGHNFRFANHLSSKYKRMGWLAKPFWQGIMYIFIPVGLVSVCLASGSISTVLFVGLVMFATLFVGEFSIKDTAIYVAIIVAAFIAGYGLFKAMPDGSKAEKMLGKVYDRVETALHRVDKYGDSVSGDVSLAEQIRNEKDINKRRKIIDDNTQTEGSKIAIKEGGITGKGPGRSTQKYRVPLIFGDYMYSFLIEEYGLWMAILVLMMYVSLLARGSRIAMMCKKTYARTAVAGLTLLISGQAMMHMLINVGYVPVTGQALPIVSDGKSSLIMFYTAFGVLLNISKSAKKQMEKAIKEEESIIPETRDTGDEVADSLYDMTQLENLE